MKKEVFCIQKLLIAQPNKRKLNKRLRLFMFVSSNKGSDCDYSGWASKNPGTPLYVRVTVTQDLLLGILNTRAPCMSSVLCPYRRIRTIRKNSNNYVSYTCPYLRYLRYYIF